MMARMRRIPYVGGIVLLAATCWLSAQAYDADAYDSSTGAQDQEPAKPYKPVTPEAGAGETKPPVAENSLRFAVMGDTGTGDRAQYDVGAQMARSRSVFPFEFVIMVGDNMYGGERPQDFVKKFEL